MAISRVPGFSLLPNLDRQGVDLQITTQGNALAYMDFTNFRFGINTSTPSESLTVNGNILVANGHIYPSANVTHDLGLPSNYWRNVYADNAVINNDLTVGGVLVIDGNVFTSNITGNIVNADEIYENTYRVLTANTTISVNGDVTGSGNYNNVYVTLNASGVSENIYGSTDYVPQIMITSKGIVTSAANVVLTRIGNLLVNDTELYTSAGNISIAPAGGNVSFANSRITNLSAPIDNTDSATKQYVDSSIASAGRSIVAYDSTVSIYDDNVSPAWITTVVDGVEVANITIANTTIYNTLQLNNFTVSGNTISATGNIILEPAYPNIVKMYGNTALQIPVGDDQDRPDDPVEGYIRYSTSRTGIEFWDGTAWQIPGEVNIISDIFTPDGVSNVFVLTANTTTQGVLVSINGTVQRPQSAYTVSNNAITFTETPLTTDIIEVRTLATGSALSSDTLGYDNSLIVADGTNLTVTGNLIPSANITYSLGSQTNQWRDLWVSNNTVYIGGTAVTVVNGQLTVGGNTVGAADPYGNINVAAYLGSENITVGGNITVTGAQKRIVGDFSNISKAQRLLFQAGSVGSTSIGVINNGGAYSEVMLYSDSDCLETAGALQTYTDEVRINTYNYSGPEIIPFTLAVGSTPVIKLNADYSTNITGNLIVSDTIVSGRWHGSTIGVDHGGTGATTSADALNNLLPSGEQTGYVLTTSGAGTYYWAAGGGGGGTVGQSLTTLRQSNTATSGQTVFELVNDLSYTPGTGQLRVYINGVRQFPDAYTETSANAYTLSTGVTAGTVVFAEIDAFSSFNNYANLTYASNVGNIAASGLTVQSAIENLENNKAPLAHPVFTGVTTIGGNLVVQGNLFVNGNVTSINANNLSISDSLIYLADDNPANTLDIGLVSSFTDAVRYQHTGFVRDATDNTWKLFANVVSEPTTTVDFTDANYSNLKVGNVQTVGDATVGANLKFTNWSTYESGDKLYFAYNGVVKMSINSNGNLIVTGDVTAFGTP